MLVWFVAFSVLGVFAVFQDPLIDYRFVVGGALAPDVVDGLSWGGLGVSHSVVSAIVVLAVVMVVTRRRTVWRRRLLALSIGVFAHLVLDGVWMSTDAFWWPLSGTPAEGPLPSFAHPRVLTVAEEIVGLVALGAMIGRFRLADPVVRGAFLRDGQLKERAG